MLGDENSFVTIDAEIRGGRPTIRGTRITLSQIIAEMAESGNHEDFCKRYSLQPNKVFEALNELAIFLDRSFSVSVPKFEIIEDMVLLLADTTHVQLMDTKADVAIAGSVVNPTSSFSQGDRVLFDNRGKIPLQCANCGPSPSLSYVLVKKELIYGKIK
jgi:uncharacterized protein (DUF433 family)